MYTETNKAGIKNFFIILLVLLITSFVTSYLSSLFSFNKLIEDLTVVAIFGVITYLTLIKYASIFEYSVDEKNLYISRKIGSRSKNIQIPLRNIKSVSASGDNLPKKKINMCSSIFSKKRAYYVVYKENNEKKAVIFEPTQSLLDRLKYNALHYWH